MDAQVEYVNEYGYWEMESSPSPPRTRFRRPRLKISLGRRIIWTTPFPARVVAISNKGRKAGLGQNFCVIYTDDVAEKCVATSPETSPAVKIWYEISRLIEGIKNPAEYL